MGEFSICIITKNEADNLDKCLGALSTLGMEIVVADTGSTDNSVEVARKYTEAVYFFEWCNDFAAARNFVAGKASSDNILMVDTDEFLTKMDMCTILEQIRSNPGKVGRIQRINLFTREDEQVRCFEYVNRFYNRKLFEYRGTIHEQLVSIMGGNFETFEMDISFEHVGYEGTAEQIMNKTERNIRLLLKEHEDMPDDPYIIYQLGKSYYMRGDYENAYLWLKKATYIDLDIRLEYVVDLIISYGYSMINTARAEEALGLEGLFDELGDIADFDFLMGLIYMKNALFTEAVSMFLNAAKKKECQISGVNSYKAFYNIGVIYECLGYPKEALKYYDMCGNYAKALDRKKELR